MKKSKLLAGNFKTEYAPLCGDAGALDENGEWDGDRKFIQRYIQKAMECHTDTFKKRRGGIVNIVLTIPHSIDISLLTDETYWGLSGVFSYLPIIYFDLKGEIIPAHVRLENSLFLVKSYDYSNAHMRLFDADKHRTELTLNNNQFYKIKSFMDLVDGENHVRVSAPTAFPILVSSKQTAADSPPVAPMYAHPHDSKITWSGRGRAPIWIQEYLKSGVNIELFLIRKDASKVAA